MFNERIQDIDSSQKPILETLVQHDGKTYRVSLPPENLIHFYEEFFSQKVPIGLEDQLQHIKNITIVQLLPQKDNHTRGTAKREKTDNPDTYPLRLFPQTISNITQGVNFKEALSEELTKTLTHESIHIMRKVLFPQEVEENNRREKRKAHAAQSAAGIFSLVGSLPEIEFLKENFHDLTISAVSFSAFMLYIIFVMGTTRSLIDKAYLTNPEEYYARLPEEKPLTSPFVIEEVISQTDKRR